MHYPWLPILKEYYIDIADKSPIEFISDVFSTEFKEEIKERTYQMFKAAFDTLEDMSYYKLDNSNVYMYILIKILLITLDNNQITNRLAELYSKINYYDLLKENDYNLYKILSKLNFNINYNENKYQYGIKIRKDLTQKLETHFRIHYIDYLKLADNLKDEVRKLVNNSVKEGFVYIQKRSLMRLLQEYVRNKILEINKERKDSKKKLKNDLFENKEFKELCENINSLWKEKKEEIDYFQEVGFKKGEDVSTIFPSCMKEILSKAKDAQNLTHIERLVILFFLLALNYPVEEITRIFSTLPDFDKDKTTYQINFAKKKGYIPHACETLKSLDLCMARKANDKLCLEGYTLKSTGMKKLINHPLSYVRRKRFFASLREIYSNDTQKVNKNERA